VNVILSFLFAILLSLEVRIGNQPIGPGTTVRARETFELRITTRIDVPLGYEKSLAPGTSPAGSIACGSRNVVILHYPYSYSDDIALGIDPYEFGRRIIWEGTDYYYFTPEVAGIYTIEISTLVLCDSLDPFITDTQVVKIDLEVVA